MEKKDLVQSVHRMMEAASCCAEAKAAGQKWLDALNTPEEATAARALVQELEEDIVPIDGLIAFAGSADGAKVFGAELAQKIEAHAKEIKAAGAKYCDCDACRAALEVIENKEVLLG